MQRLKALFPTLARMEPHELMLLPLAIVFLVAPASYFIHRGYEAMGWITNDDEIFQL